jgi:hypothetical protein
MPRRRLGRLISSKGVLSRLFTHQGVAVWLGGRLFDLSGSYTFAFMTAIVSGVLAIASMWTGNTLAARLQAPAERSPTA